MKQLLFLLLFPCLCVAQYTGNAGQKITLGEQTTADGLVYRGLAADTTRKPSVDTMAYILLDTNTNIIWQYKKATSNAWLRLNLLPSDTSSMLTNYYRSGRALGTPLSGTLTNATGLPLTSGVTGVLPMANGGTGSATLSGASIITGSGTSNKIPKFNTTNSLTISKLNDDATTLTYTGNEIVAGDNLNNDAFFTMNAIQNNYLQFKDADGGSGAINYNHTNDYLAFKVNGFNRLTIINNGNVGIGTTSPTARLHLAAGTATAYTAPLKFTSGTNLTTAEAGAMEFNGTNLFFSPSTTRHTVNHGLTGSATLNFPSTTTLLSADLTITVTGAADGDVVSLGVPNAAVNANTCYTAWVSAANTVTVRFNNYSSGTVDPASASFKVFVTK